MIKFVVNNNTMAKKIEIIGNALVITNTVTNEIVAESPKQLVYYNVDRLEKGVVEVINIDSTNQVQLTLVIGTDFSSFNCFDNNCFVL